MRSGLVAAVLIGCGGGASAPDAAAPPIDTAPPSIDAGLVPGDPIDLGGNEDPSVLVTDDGTLVVAYFSDEGGNPDLYLRTSRDGVTWTAPVQITTAPEADFYPTLIEANGRFHLSWFRRDPPPTNYATVWYASTDDLSTWPTGVQVASGAPIEDQVPTIAATATGLEIVFVSKLRGATGRQELYAVTSTDGAAWSAPTELDVNDPAQHDHLPVLVPSAGGLTMAWVRCDDTEPLLCLSNSAELFTATSTDGLTWTSPAQVTSDTEIDVFPDLYATSDHDLALAWVTTAIDMNGSVVGLPLGGVYPTDRTDLPLTGYSPKVAATHTPGVYLGAWVDAAHDIWVRLFAH